MTTIKFKGAKILSNTTINSTFTKGQVKFILGNSTVDEMVGFTAEQMEYITKFNTLSLNQKQRLIMKHKALPPVEEIEKTISISAMRKSINNFFTQRNGKRHDKNISLDKCATYEDVFEGEGIKE
jgi:hypothetical protein